jgi:hypothetical protein
MRVMYRGAGVFCYSWAWELVRTFLNVRFKREERINEEDSFRTNLV